MSLKQLYNLQCYRELIWRGKDKLHLGPSSLDEFAKRAKWHNADDVLITVTTMHNAEPEIYHERDRQHNFYRHNCQIIFDASEMRRDLRLKLEKVEFTGQPHSDNREFYQWTHFQQVTLQERLAGVKLRIRYEQGINLIL